MHQTPREDAGVYRHNQPGAKRGTLDGRLQQFVPDYEVVARANSELIHNLLRATVREHGDKVLLISVPDGAIRSLRIFLS